MSKLNRKPQAPVLVDTHIHLFPDKLYSAIRDWFAKVGWQIDYPYKTNQVLDILKDFGVEEVWALVYAHRQGVAENLNAWLGEIARKHDMVRGFFSVHPEDNDPAKLTIEALDKHGLTGMKLHAEVQQLAVDDTRLDKTFSILEERRRPCLVHSGDAPYPYTKPNLDVACVAKRLCRNPELILIIAHLGANQTEQYLELTKDYQNLYLEVSFTNFPQMPTWQRPDYSLLKPYSDRLLFGSDFPNITFTYADQADAWWEFDWIREDAKEFFGNRARRIISLGE